MSKRKSGDARVDKSEKSKKLVEKAGVGFDEKPNRWPEFKRQGRLRAVKMGFDKPLTFDEMKALDIDDLLSERR